MKNQLMKLLRCTSKFELSYRRVRVGGYLFAVFALALAHQDCVCLAISVANSAICVTSLS